MENVADSERIYVTKAEHRGTGRHGGRQIEGVISSA